MSCLETFYLNFRRKQTPMKTVFQQFEQKSIIFSDISLPRLGKNISIPIQNIIESPKQIS